MITEKLASIQNEIQLKIKKCEDINYTPNIIAVSKTFPIKHITPLINHGHLHFGENKVQEALDKWTHIKKENEKINLHMIGKLQTNKVKYVVELFDYIHSLDNKKLAEKISSEQVKKNKNLKIFIQVNIGNELQKSGISIDDLPNFYDYCINILKLNIIGLMCIPPKNINNRIFFDKMKKIKNLINVKELSMGMSDDYLDAVEFGSTYLRIGSKIFGPRD